MKIFILHQEYEDGDGNPHDCFLGAYTTREKAEEAKLAVWRATRLKDTDGIYSNQQHTQDAIVQSRKEFNERVRSGPPPDEEFPITEYELE